MKSKNIVFTLDDNEKFMLSIKDEEEYNFCCFFAEFVFVQDSTIYKLADDTALSLINLLICIFEKAINNELKIHDSIKSSIGLLGAEYFFYSFDKNMVSASNFIFDEQETWIGLNHLFLGLDIAVWVYNNDQGEIVLEFTPWYKGERFDPDLESEYIEYKEFLRTYKSCFIRKIPHHVVRQWLDQAYIVLDQIRKNICCAELFHTSDE